MSEIYKLQISTITVNGSTQARTEINQSIVAEYSEALKAGTVFPPVIVFEDGASIWLADGFHRYHAHLHAGLSEIDCDVRIGTQRQAILFSLSANASHGLRRTNEDKRKAAMTLLNDDEWSSWTDVAIAKACGVSSNFIGDMRRIINPINDAKIRKVERNGKTYEQDTSNIGKKSDTEKQQHENKPATAANPVPHVTASEEEKHDDDAPDLHELISWTDVAIAKACGVSSNFIGDMRRIINPINDAKIRKVERNGKTYEQDTSNIGKKSDTEKQQHENKPATAANPVPHVTASEEEKHDDDAPDLHELIDEIQKENELLLRENESLKSDDLGKEVARLTRALDQLNGRLQGEITTCNEAKKQAKFYGDILAKIRKKLGVNSNSEILSALGA